MNRIGYLITLIFLLFVYSSAQSAERRELEGAAIIGNRELPKVLYIVPWQAAQTTDKMERLQLELLEEGYQPLDRDVFSREITYGAQIRTMGTRSGTGEAISPVDKP